MRIENNVNLSLNENVGVSLLKKEMNDEKVLLDKLLESLPDLNIGKNVDLKV
jgi:hypothetical protein